MKSRFCGPFCVAFLLIVLWGILPATGARAQSGPPSHEMAIQAMKSGDLKSALAHIQQALIDYPDNLDFQYGLGMIYLRLGRIDEAEAVFQALVRQDEEKFRRVYFELARIVQDRGKDVDAAALLKKGRQADPGRADFELGILYLRMKEYANALESFRKARIEKPEIAAEAMIHEAIALGYLKKYGDARKLLESVLKMSITKNQAEFTKRLMSGLDDAKRGAKRWHVSGLVGFQYDSNIFQSPVDSAGNLPTGKSDFVNLNTITTRYDVYRDDPWVLGAGYNHYNLTYFNHPSLGNVAARPNLYAYWNKAPFFAGVDYLYSHYWTDMKSRANIHALYPVFVMSGGNRWRTEVRGWTEWRDFDNDSPSERFYGFGVTEYYMFMKGLAHIRGGVNLDFDDTMPKSAGSYHDVMFTAGVQFPVWKNKWFLDVSGYITQRDFRSSPSFSFDQARSDNEQDLYVILRGPLPKMDNVQLLLMFQQTWNDSNITQASETGSFDPFNYRRTVVSCMLAFEY